MIAVYFFTKSISGDVYTDKCYKCNSYSDYNQARTWNTSNFKKFN